MTLSNSSSVNLFQPIYPNPTNHNSGSVLAGISKGNASFSSANLPNSSNPIDLAEPNAKDTKFISLVPSQPKKNGNDGYIFSDDFISLTMGVSALAGGVIGIAIGIRENYLDEERNTQNYHQSDQGHFITNFNTLDLYHFGAFNLPARNVNIDSGNINPQDYPRYNELLQALQNKYPHQNIANLEQERLRAIETARSQNQVQIVIDNSQNNESNDGRSNSSLRLDAVLPRPSNLELNPHLPRALEVANSLARNLEIV